jgi:two-component system, OmpR family, sensor kinase
MVLVLAGAALFVYLRLRADLDDSVNSSLHARADALAARQAGARPAGTRGAVLVDPEENLAQVIASDGRLLSAAGGARRAALTPAEVRRAARRSVLVERRIPGIEATARVLARPAATRGGRVVVAVGQSLGDRNDALSGVVTSFAVGGGVAVVLASIVGYGLASAGLAPVEAMRRRAREVSLSRDGEQLPLPAARDEVRRLGETLNEMLERLRRSFEREQRFVADASHELRTPIAVVRTELEGALHAGDYGPEVREALVAALTECDRLSGLAEDLLVIARATEAGLPVRREPMRVRPLLEGVRQRFADRAEHQGRGIRIDAADEERLDADPLRVRQALGNLVDNALRHGGGEIVIGARRAAAGIELEVADEGPGFAPGIAARAFERFARGDAARGGGGSGLGLAIVRAIAEAHDGRAAIVPGRGATVRLWLPDGPGATTDQRL